MEKLFAYAFLWICNLDEVTYGEVLDKMFMDSPENEILLELECLSVNCEYSFFRIKRYFDYEKESFNKELFGKSLFAGLEKIYASKKVPIREFAKCTYEMWKMFPRDIAEEEPFFILTYAGDPLSWGDELQTRALYETAFSFYKTNDG